MEITLVIILLLVVWVNLQRKINKNLSKTDALMQEIAGLKKLLESDQSVTEEKPAYHIPVLSVEIRKEKEDVSPVKPQKEKRSVNYEKYIGENLFGKIGILILVVGIGLFVKYAIDNEWINETLRTVLGFAVGVGLLALAAKLKDTYRTFSSLLAGGAFAIFYVTVAIAYHYYGLFSQTAAFVVLVALTVLMSCLAVFYNRRELAVIALVGGFIAPFLVSNGMGSYLVLLTYVMILDAGMFTLSIYKKWGELPVICFVFTWLILLGYALATDLDLMSEGMLMNMLGFTGAFYLIFQLSVVSIVRINTRRINQLLLGVVAINNFVFLFFSLWFLRLMNLANAWDGMFTLFIAIINIALFLWMRWKDGGHFSFLLHTLLGIAITFISITIPIQLHGTLITLFWASEMVIILWFYTRLRSKVYEVFALLLPVLTFVSYLMDIGNACMGDTVSGQLFMNGTFATGIFSGIAFVAYALLLAKMQEVHRSFNALAIGVGCFLFYISFLLDFYLYIGDSILSGSLMQVFTAATLLLLTWLPRSRFPVSVYPGIYKTALCISVLLFLYTSFVVNEGSPKTMYPLLIQWLSLVILIGHTVYLGWLYYGSSDYRTKAANGMTVLLSILSTVLLVAATNNLLIQLGLSDESNAGFSISLSIAGFIQMALGMRLHLKVVRMISLVTFGLVLLKLALIDLWLLPTIGKVIVFVILGVLLLVLSFLYQKLKTVLFKNSAAES